MNDSTHYAIYNMTVSYNEELAVIESPNRFVLLDGDLTLENLVTGAQHRCVFGSRGEFEVARLFMMNAMLDEYRQYVSMKGVE